MGSKKALVVVANGSEEIESVTPIDVQVTVAGLGDSTPKICSRDVIVGVEMSLMDANGSCPYDAILLPGGLKGAEAFVESEELGEMLREQDKAGRLVASICAGPTALKKHGIGLGKSITSYPGVKDKLLEGNLYTYKEDRVVVDGNVITSRGPGTALEWSLAIVENLVGKEKADQVGKAMLLKD
ncbi:Protein deglycase DJ-1 [Folsomia candida]|uniref:Protein deglycase DJ-1 n=1 Tax=Folsomia candida TaxID=158441 RepID=A0A226E2M1_FOLCA|nr:Protein deglycase DJ-1 [Folsomia candida]